MKKALVTTPDALAEVAHALGKHEIIGIDTEFIRETTFFPRIALIQAATRDEVWLIDPTTLGPEDMRPFLDVLLDRKILKVMHAAFADQECLYWAYQICADPVIDTSVAAAMCGMGDNAGLGKLLKETMNLIVPKGRARVKWLTRPLPEELCQYAEQDVAHLVDLAEILIEKLRSHDRLDWAMAESHLEESEFDVPPEEIAARIAKSAQMDPVTYSTLIELVRWREDRAKRANLPRGWVADNEILVALSKVRPKSIDELKTFRGLNVKEVERSGRHIMEAMEYARNHPRNDFPVSKRGPIPSEKEEHVLDLVRAYVTYLAAKLEISPRFLLASAKTLPLVYRANDAIEDWVGQEILSPAAAKLVGSELKALLGGKRALVLREGRVEILTV